MDQKIDHDPVLNWWVKAVLKKRLIIIFLVKKSKPSYLKKTHKFVIEVTNYISQAYALDKIMVTPFGQMPLPKRRRM